MHVAKRLWLKENLLSTFPLISVDFLKFKFSRCTFTIHFHLLLV